MDSLASHIFTEVYHTCKERSYAVFPIHGSNEFQMKIGKNSGPQVFFHAWIDKRFNEKGEICLLLSRRISPIPRHFNGAIYLNGKEIIINNYGFFREQEAASIRLQNEDSLLKILCGEVQSWSETMYD